jgi:hypothetical protein
MLSSACVPGLSNPSLATCNGNGGSRFIDPADNYTCNAGYYVTVAPTYCECMMCCGLSIRQDIGTSKAYRRCIVLSDRNIHSVFQPPGATVRVIRGGLYLSYFPSHHSNFLTLFLSIASCAFTCPPPPRAQHVFLVYRTHP